eukprot:jgi/Mesvir1/7575/Mv04542-RA.1
MTDVYVFLPREYLQDQTVYYIKNVSNDVEVRNWAVMTGTFVQGGLELWLEREKASTPAAPSVNNRAWGIENKVTWSGFGLNVVPAGQDKDSVSGKTMQECAAICARDSNRCAGFTWRANEQTPSIGSCWFKSDVTSKAIPSSRTFYTLTNPDFRNPASALQSVAQSSGQAATAAAIIGQTFSSVNAATKDMYAINKERGDFVRKKVFTPQPGVFFTVRNISDPKNPKSGTWKGSDVSKYLDWATFPDYPVSRRPEDIQPSDIARGMAFVTSWTSTGIQGETVTGFTVQWKSKDHGYLYDVTVPRSQIPPSATSPAATSQQAAVTPPATAPPSAPATSSAPVIPPATAPAPTPGLPPYLLIGSLWVPDKVHLALAEEIKRVQANQWDENAISALPSSSGGARLTPAKRREIVVSTLLARLTRDLPTNDIEVLASQRGYISPPLMSVLLGWGDLIRTWKAGDVPSAVALENELSKSWASAMRGPMADGVVGVSTVQQSYNYRANDFASTGHNMSRINTFVANQSADYSTRAQTRAVAVALGYSVIPLPSATSTTATTASTRRPRRPRQALRPAPPRARSLFLR